MPDSLPARPARRGGFVDAPIASDNVPQRGNALTRIAATAVMRLAGWKFTGTDFPDVRKVVLIVAPHTSNWDFVIGVAAKYAIGLRGTFLGKDALFRFPLGLLMRWLGGVPVDRTAKSDVVTQTVELVQRSERILIALAPEGTRKYVPRWRSGFWWIAQRAGVPILPVAFDFGTKSIHLFPLVHTTGDQDADIARIRALYHPRMAYDPAKFAVPGEALPADPGAARP